MLRHSHPRSCGRMRNMSNTQNAFAASVIREGGYASTTSTVLSFLLAPAFPKLSIFFSSFLVHDSSRLATISFTTSGIRCDQAAVSSLLPISSLMFSTDLSMRMFLLMYHPLQHSHLIVDLLLDPRLQSKLGRLTLCLDFLHCPFCDSVRLGVVGKSMFWHCGLTPVADYLIL